MSRPTDVSVFVSGVRVVRIVVQDGELRLEGSNDGLAWVTLARSHLGEAEPIVSRALRGLLENLRAPGVNVVGRE